MMKSRLLTILLLLLALAGCEAPKGDNSIGGYYDVDSLLTQACLNKVQFPVKAVKTVVIDGEAEEQILSLDAESMEEEITMLRMLDINGSGLVGAYLEEQNGTEITYRLKDEERQKGITELMISGEPHSQNVTGTFLEENTLYFTSRKFQVNIKDHLLHSFHISGTQKMMFKDTVSFSVTLTIQ